MQSNKITHNEELAKNVANDPAIQVRLVEVYREIIAPLPQPGTLPTTQAPQTQQPEHQKLNKPFFIFRNSTYITGAALLAVAALCAYRYYTATTNDDSEDTEEASVQETKL
jgi:hypothetical protein